MTHGDREHKHGRQLPVEKGDEVLITLEPDQLDIFGQVFRPIFAGVTSEVRPGYITLNPVIIKMSNAPNFRFPTPLSFPMNQIVTIVVPFDLNTSFPIP